ncbi:putative keratin, type I cytoskeletal 13-like isoform X1 [Streptomyces rapamycinicus NRRL 5491]|uniref:Putative keratin, type I cytoskeletal 13-like isoform X1 n=1 Tax=Streptomyces rapamycinicus (strain ATCC 29253 / DSM 41530 / NRRL 5491 / AYB-994) TaxID=1343740 RepID=A0A3L8R1T2_STRRN|nr:putative keratin, type I cytoskeletal 13-like isoform X1 [Streptomyces rapamycinicus NRRL 5491]
MPPSPCGPGPGPGAPRPRPRTRGLSRGPRPTEREPGHSPAGGWDGAPAGSGDAGPRVSEHSPAGSGTQPHGAGTQPCAGAGAQPHGAGTQPCAGAGAQPHGGRDTALRGGRGTAPRGPGTAPRDPGHSPAGRGTALRGGRGTAPRDPGHSPAGRGTALRGGRGTAPRGPGTALRAGAQPHGIRGTALRGPGGLPPGSGRGGVGNKTPDQRPNSRAQPTEPEQGHSPRQPRRARGATPHGSGARPRWGPRVRHRVQTMVASRWVRGESPPPGVLRCVPGGGPLRRCSGPGPAPGR